MSLTQGLVPHGLVPGVCRDKPSVVVNMSARVGSISDNQLGGWYSYRASKTALNQLTKTMAIECTRRKSNVSCIMLHPGTVDTDLSAPFQKVLCAMQHNHLLWTCNSARLLVQRTKHVTCPDLLCFHM